MIEKPDPTSKRARTKVTIGKSKSKSKTSKTDKVSRILRSTGVKKKSSTKVKSFPLSPKVDLSAIDGSLENSSSFVDIKKEKETDLEETKSSTPEKVIELEKKEEKPKKKRVKDRSKEKKDVDVSEGSTKKSTKRKRKAPPLDDVEKKLPDGSRKREKTDLEVSETSKSKKKQKSVKHAKAKTKSLSKNDMGSKVGDIELKDKVSIYFHFSPYTFNYMKFLLLFS